MIDWDLVEEYTENAQGIAFENCHKIYVLMDTEQVALMREYEYDFVHTAEEMSSSEMLATLKEWFEKSCPLRFVEATETKNEDTEFTTLIEQGATDEEECEDCNDPTCRGVCYNDTEDEDEDEDEDEE
jgi:hypothetical protein